MTIKELFIMKWCKAFEDHIYLYVVVRRTSMSYTICHDVTYASMCPPLKTDVLFSKELGSIEQDMIVCTLHTYVLCQQYNEDVYFKLDEACRGTKYTDSLKPFQKKKMW